MADDSYTGCFVFIILPPVQTFIHAGATPCLPSLHEHPVLAKPGTIITHMVIQFNWMRSPQGTRPRPLTSQITGTWGSVSGKDPWASVK